MSLERNSTISPNFHTTHLINGIGQGITATMSSSVLLCQLLPLAQHGNIRPSRTCITGRSLQQTVHHTTGFRIGILKGFNWQLQILNKMMSSELAEAWRKMLQRKKMETSEGDNLFSGLQKRCFGKTKWTKKQLQPTKWGFARGISLPVDVVAYFWQGTVTPLRGFIEACHIYPHIALGFFS